MKKIGFALAASRGTAYLPGGDPDGACATRVSVELIEELTEQARRRLAGDGYHGWPEYARFDEVIVTLAPELIPPELIYQFKPGGKRVIPAGLPDSQQLILVDKDVSGSVSTREIFTVRFLVA